MSKIDSKIDRVHAMLNGDAVDFGSVLDAMSGTRSRRVFSRPIEPAQPVRPIEPADVLAQPVQGQTRQERTAQAHARRQRIIDFVESYFASHYRPPTIREICAGAGIDSASMILFHMRALCQSGQIVDTGDHGESRRYVPAWLPGVINREMEAQRAARQAAGQASRQQDAGHSEG
jgi:hypothetical protein